MESLSYTYIVKVEKGKVKETELLKEGQFIATLDEFIYLAQRAGFQLIREQDEDLALK
jgi:hypothetical protein